MTNYDKPFSISTAYKSFNLQWWYVTHDHVKNLYKPQIHPIMEKIEQLELKHTLEIHQFRMVTFLEN